MSSILEAQNLIKNYSDVKAVDGISFTLNSGDCFAGQKNTYSPVVEWVTDNGQKITAKARFGSTRSSDYQVGRQLSVIYDRNSPAKKYYVLKDGITPKVGIADYVLLIFGAVFLFGGIMTIIKGA